jgi:hypothetical protein
LSRRVVLGKRLDGSFGLDVTLPGYDALLNDRNDAGKFSFSSDWTDFVGLAQITTVPVDSNPVPTYFFEFPIVNNGYIPHVELRVISGLRIFDDTYTDAQTGVGGIVTANKIQIEMLTVGFNVMCFVFKQPMAAQ